MLLLPQNQGATQLQLAGTNGLIGGSDKTNVWTMTKPTRYALCPRETISMQIVRFD